jgi:hypothetical protein
VENRNSHVRDKTVWELIADLWNDPTFEPRTEGNLSDLHIDFAEPIDLRFEKVASMNPANPKLVQGKFSAMITELTRIIANWERSGQGEGGFYANEDLDEPLEKEHPLFGSLDGRERASLDLRCNFCEDHQTYLLYLWHILDRHQLLQTSLNALPDDVAAADGGESVPSVISTAAASAKKNHRDSAHDALEKIAAKIGESNTNELREYAKRRLDDIDDKKSNVRLKIFQCRRGPDADEELARFWEGELEKLEEKGRRVEQEIQIPEASMETPQRHNHTPVNNMSWHS